MYQRSDCLIYEIEQALGGHRFALLNVATQKGQGLGEHGRNRRQGPVLGDV